jgi:transcription elongation factor Elf1
MYIIRLTDFGHKWEKQNLVTLFKKKRSYDIMKCVNCGIKGETINLAEIGLKASYSENKVYCCPGSAPDIPKRIKITHCDACGIQFANILPQSEYDVVTPPEGYKNDHTGVWVMGIGEPVKILSNEFTIIC